MKAKNLKRLLTITVKVDLKHIHKRPFGWHYKIFFYWEINSNLSTSNTNNTTRKENPYYIPQKLHQPLNQSITTKTMGKYIISYPTEYLTLSSCYIAIYYQQFTTLFFTIQEGGKEFQAKSKFNLVADFSQKYIHIDNLVTEYYTCHDLNDLEAPQSPFELSPDILSTCESRHQISSVLLLHLVQPSTEQPALWPIALQAYGWYPSALTQPAKDVAIGK